MKRNGVSETCRTLAAGTLHGNIATDQKIEKKKQGVRTKGKDRSRATEGEIVSERERDREKDRKFPITVKRHAE